MSSQIRISVLLIAFSIILFTGCKSIKDTIIPRQPKLDRPFSCTFELTAFADDRDSKMVVSGDITRYGTGIWEMNIASPDTMKGLNIKYNEGGATASLGSLTLEIESGKLNEAAMFKRIFDAFDSCAALHDIELFDDGETAVYNGADFTLAFDKATMLPTLLTFSDGITVNISSFCGLTEQTPEVSESIRQSDGMQTDEVPTNE